MRELTGMELLNLWERGQAEPPARRALALLAAACPETPVGELARLEIGRRDRLLLALRERTIGPRLGGVAACPACGGRLELELAVDDLLVAEGAVETPLTLAAAGFEVRFRLPNSLDLLALDGADPDPAAARCRLLAACLLEARSPDGGPAPAEALPEAVLHAVAARMSEADPQAEIELALECAVCGQSWLAPLDVVAFLWAEIDALARRLLYDVHVLASAYGWREAEILALSPWRRRAYLEMAGA
jgi:hypothetical protein